MSDITLLLERWQSGEEEALSELVPLVQAKLVAIAKRQLQSERKNHTFSCLDLVNEAYVHFCRTTPTLVNSKHFFSCASKIMRHTLINYAKYKNAEKRKGELEKFVTENLEIFGAQSNVQELLELDDALKALEEWDPRKAQVIELSYFVGMTAAEMSETLNVSEPTVKRDLSVAKAFMSRFLRGRKR